MFESVSAKHFRANANVASALTLHMARWADRSKRLQRSVVREARVSVCSNGKSFHRSTETRPARRDTSPQKQSFYLLLRRLLLFLALRMCQHQSKSGVPRAIVTMSRPSRSPRVRWQIETSWVSTQKRIACHDAPSRNVTLLRRDSAS